MTRMTLKVFKFLALHYLLYFTFKTITCFPNNDRVPYFQEEEQFNTRIDINEQEQTIAPFYGNISSPLDKFNNQDVNQRQNRRINLLNFFLYRPKTSPLYLINGTVCRLINGQPICTTLATSGLISRSSGSAAIYSTAALQSGSQSNVEYAINNQNQQQSTRPIVTAPLMGEYDSQSVMNATSSGNLSNSTIDYQGFETTNQPPRQFINSTPINMPAAVPVVLTRRRPLNLLGFRRPLVQAYQPIRG